MLRWLLAVSAVAVGGFAVDQTTSQPSNCQDVDDSAVAQHAESLGLVGIASCHDVAENGLCNHADAVTGCCATCWHRRRKLQWGGPDRCQGSGAPVHSATCSVSIFGGCSFGDFDKDIQGCKEGQSSGKDEPDYGPCCRYYACTQTLRDTYTSKCYGGRCTSTTTCTSNYQLRI